MHLPSAVSERLGSRTLGPSRGPHKEHGYSCGAPSGGVAFEARSDRVPEKPQGSAAPRYPEGARPAAPTHAQLRVTKASYHRVNVATQSAIGSEEDLCGSVA